MPTSRREFLYGLTAVNIPIERTMVGGSWVWES